MEKDLVLTLIMVACILPLCFLPDLERFRFNSYFIFGVIVYVDLVLIYTFGDKSHNNQAPAPGFTPVERSITFM